jgi:hypothetical protein
MATRTTREGKSPKKKKTTAQASEEVKLLQRRTWALDLQRQGLNYRQIARRLKELKLVPQTYSHGLAYKDCKDAIRTLIEDQKELAEENLRLDLLRLEEMFERVYPLAIPQPEEEGDLPPPPDPIYFSAVMAILDKRAQYLNYKALWAEKEKPNFNVNINWSEFSLDEIIEIQQRIQAGEDALVVIAGVQHKNNKPADKPAAGG